MNEPVDLRDIHKLWMGISTVKPSQSQRSSQGNATIDPQVDDGPIDLVFTRQYRALSVLHHPAIAAIIAHQNATYDPYHVQPSHRIEAA